MNQLKSIYVSAFIAASLAGLITALVRLSNGAWNSAWLGTALACSAPVLFFARAYTFPIARTTANMHLMLGAGTAGAVLSILLGGDALAAPVLIASGVGVVGVVLYVYWYSRFDPPEVTVLREGAALPTFQLQEQGRTVSSSELITKPALWIFYRGNWCPLCMAQIREVAAEYRELARRGVEVFLISPQPAGHTASLASKFDVPMRFMTDADNAAAKTLGVMEKSGLPAGMQVLGYDSDVPRPTVFISAAGGRLIYCDLSSNYRVRPEPSEFLAVLDRHAMA
jgi:peroxiredoxin